MTCFLYLVLYTRSSLLRLKQFSLPPWSGLLCSRPLFWTHTWPPFHCLEHQYRCCDIISIRSIGWKLCPSWWQIHRSYNTTCMISVLPSLLPDSSYHQLSSRRKIKGLFWWVWNLVFFLLCCMCLHVLCSCAGIQANPRMVNTPKQSTSALELYTNVKLKRKSPGS